MFQLLTTFKEAIEAKFDLSIALALSTWPALTLAVQENWGGPNALDKRDWFAGAISELIASPPDGQPVDAVYLEDFMLQVMNDEFDVNIEDDSAEEVAHEIMRFRLDTEAGDFTRVDEMMRLWQEKQGKGTRERIGFARGQDEDNDTDWDDDDDDDDDDNDEGDGSVDIEMDEAPPLVKAQREKPVPEVDDDGFTKVVGRKKR